MYDQLYLTLIQGRCCGDIAVHIYDTDYEGRFLSEDGIFSKYVATDELLMFKSDFLLHEMSFTFLWLNAVDFSCVYKT